MPIFTLQKSFAILQKTESVTDFSNFLAEAKSLEQYGEIAGFFPSKYTVLFCNKKKLTFRTKNSRF